MTADRWREITAVFHAALGRDPATRDAFLDDACRHDPSLRAEVDALVAAHQDAGSFGDIPLTLPPGMKRLSPGKQLGAFRIEALLGVGGMGEVYRATDTRLGRAVAIKVLPDSVARNPDRLARLEREARVLAALNHPNIAAIYGIEEADAVRALVLELVEGETLADRLAAQRTARLPGSGDALRVREALDIARQIAEALEAAHEKGIVHRDLKPGNIALTRDSGIVKVLDFGLAKAVDRDDSDQSQPTLLAHETREGVILGTAPYMSPEQARGLPVDKRTDIWAFGCVLYELLTGRLAFSGATITDTVVAILEREPDWSALPSVTPVHVKRLLRRTLEKSPALRLRDIGDARIELLSGTEDENLAPPNRGSGLTRRFAYLTVAAIGGVAIAMFLLGRQAAIGRPDQSTATPPAFRQLTFRRGVVQTARFAADGKTIVYSASWDGNRPEIYIGNIDSPESRTLGWPDSVLMAISRTNEIALGLRCGVDVFFAGCGRGTFARAPLAGGAPRALATDVTVADWGPSGELAVVRARDGLNRVEFPIGRSVHEGRGVSHLRIDPQGRRVAVLDFQKSGVEVILVERDGTKRTLSGTWPGISGAAWSPSGDELWFSGIRGRLGTLNAVTLDGRERSVLRMPGSVRLYDINDDGSVLLARVNLHDVTMIKAPDQDVAHPSSWFDSAWEAGFSADGKLLLFTERGEAVGGKPTMYLRPTDGATAPVRLGEGAAIALSDDGAWGLAVRSASSKQQLVVVPTGAGDSIVLPRGAIETYDDTYGAFFPGGRRVLFHGIRRGEGLRAFVQDLPAGEPRAITPDLAYVGRGVVSPDGQWVAASTNDPGGVRHLLYPVAGGTPRPIPGARPEDAPIQWSADGSEIYMRTWTPFTSDLDTKVFRLSLRTGARTLLRTIGPADRAGAGFPRGISMTRDARAYAYHYPQMFNDLFLATGLK